MTRDAFESLGERPTSSTPSTDDETYESRMARLDEIIAELDAAFPAKPDEEQPISR